MPTNSRKIPDLKRKPKKAGTTSSTEFVDHERGEWFGTVKEDGTPVKGDKINFWKCPYHNARACAEMWRRIGKA
jgi:mannobiose 2-epimerase